MRVTGRAPLARAALCGTVLFGALLCVAAARTYALLPNTTRPVPHSMAGALRNLSFNLTPGGAFAAVLCTCVCFATTVVLVRELSPRLVLGAIVVLNVLAVLGPPLFSTDVFSYQAYARLFIAYGIDPYSHGPHVIAADPVYRYVGSQWISTPSDYGPLFTLLSAATAHASIATSQQIFRMIAAACSLGTAAVLWVSATRRDVDPVRAVALFGLNPLVFLFGVGGGHNDLLMLLLSTGGVYALIRSDASTGAGLLAFSAAIKLSSLLLAPFALLSDAAAGRRLRFVVGFVVAAVIAAAAGLDWFGSGLSKLPSTLRTVEGHRNSQSLPGVIQSALGHSAGQIASTVLLIVFIIVLLYLLIAVARGELDWITGAAWATVALLLTASSLVAWYGTWLLPLVALCRGRRLWAVTLCLSAALAGVAAAQPL